MRRLAWMLAVSAMVAAPGWAAAAGQGAKAPQGGDRKLSSKSAEVARLQENVPAEEAKSREADHKMEEQDRAIADLRRQLEQLKGTHAAPGKGP